VSDLLIVALRSNGSRAAMTAFAREGPETGRSPGDDSRLGVEVPTLRRERGEADSPMWGVVSIRRAVGGQAMRSTATYDSPPTPIDRTSAATHRSSSGATRPAYSRSRTTSLRAGPSGAGAVLSSSVIRSTGSPKACASRRAHSLIVLAGLARCIAVLAPSTSALSKSPGFMPATMIRRA
jgi:hypothetical protein